MLTIDHGSASTRDEHGRFTAQFTLTYEKTREDGTHVQVRRQLTERGINTVGPVVSRKADREEAWNIRVTDAAGVDVTQEFDCFRD